MTARRTTIAALAVAGALIAAPPAPAAEYVPFVTDFPEPVQEQPFIPGVTDMGISPREPGRTVVVSAPRPAPGPTGSGFDWGDAAVGAGSGAAITAALAAAGLAAVRRRGGGVRARPAA